MPPVTPSAMSAMIIGEWVNWRVGELNHQVTNSLSHQFLLLDLFYGLRDHFLLRDRRLLVLADRDAGRRPGEELARAGAGGDDEFERILELAAVNHENVLTMRSASPRIRGRRARSAMIILWRRSTAAARSSLTTTKSYS